MTQLFCSQCYATFNGRLSVSDTIIERYYQLCLIWPLISLRTNIRKVKESKDRIIETLKEIQISQIIHSLLFNKHFTAKIEKNSN